MTAVAYEFRPSRTHTDLFSGLLRAKSQFGGKHEILVDGDDRVLTYNEVVRAAFGL